MLYIAEKPELARAIVEALGGGSKKKGYYDCGDDKVTWCFGHMLRLYEPEEYDPKFKGWALDTLPIVFVPWKKRPVEKTKEQLQIIVGLLKTADIVVNAGDPDAEGQLLVDEILDYAEYRGPVKRVLINDNTTALVQKAIANLHDNADFKGLSAAAEARQIGDALYGFNMTRLYTLTARREGYTGVLSVGRVQTPILGLVVRRDRENSGHIKMPYFLVSGTFRTAGGNQLKAAYLNKTGDTQDDKGRLTDEAQAKSLAAGFTGKTATVKSVDVKRGDTPPPLPYNLLKLQSDASRLHGINPDKTKEITQTLREKHKLITYNRSDSQYLSDEQHQDAPEVIAALSENLPDFEPYFASIDASVKSRAFNSAKVTAHHAIIPTRQRVNVSHLSGDERRIFHLIARAYLVQFMPPQQWEATTAVIEMDGNLFTFKARTILDNGWRGFFDGDSDEDEDEEEQPAAVPLAVGDTLNCLSGNCDRKETAPKPLYSMSSLLEDLTRVAQYVTDPQLRQTLLDKDKGKAGERGGIGTPATRDEIIATLLSRGFIESRKVGRKTLVVSTDTGRDFYDALPDTARFPNMTALWHDQQTGIERGETSVNDFVSGLVSYIQEEIARVSEHGLNLKIEKHPCPTCGSAMLKRSGKKGPFWACSSYPACVTTLPDENGRPGVKNKIIAAIDPNVVCSECGKHMRYITHPKGDFFGCSGFPQCKNLVRAKDGQPVQEAVRPSASEKHKCPHCGRGLVRRPAKDAGKHFWGCSGYPECRSTFSDLDGKPNYETAKKKESK